MSNHDQYREKRNKEMHAFVGGLVRMGMDVDTPGDMRKAAYMAKRAGLYSPSTYVKDIKMEKHFNQYHALTDRADFSAFRPDPADTLAKVREALTLIACKWEGIGTCPSCGMEHGACYPKSSEDLMREIASSALALLNGGDDE